MSLTETQLHDNIDALTAQHAPPADIQGYLDSLQKNPDGTYAPKGQEAPAGPERSWATPFPATGNETPGAALGNALGNLIPGGIATGVGMVKMPFQVAGDLTKAPGAIAQNFQGGFLPGAEKTLDAIPEYMYNTFMPNLAKHAIEAGGAGLGMALAPHIASTPQQEADIKNRGNQTIDAALSGASKNLQENPIGEIAPFFMAGREAAYKVSPEVGTTFDRAVTAAGKPVVDTAKTASTVVGKAADVPGNIARYGVSQATGLFPQTIGTIEANTKAFSKDAMAGVTRSGIADEIKNALDAREEQLSETGSQYNAIRDMKMPATAEEGTAPYTTKTVNLGGKTVAEFPLTQIPDAQLSLPELRSKLGMLKAGGAADLIGGPMTESERAAARSATSEAIRQEVSKQVSEQVPHAISVPVGYLGRLIRDTTGLTLEDGKLTASGDSSIRDPGDVRALQHIYDLWKPVFSKGKLTNTETLNFRTDLAKIAKFDRQVGKSKPLENLSGIMRGKFNSAHRGKIPGLEALDTKIAPMFDEVKALRKGILDREGNLTDAAVSKIANATNKGRDIFLNRLEQIVPGITHKIRILKAIEDIENVGGQKVGTYARATIGPGGIIAGVATGNLPMIAGAIAATVLASPEAAVPLIRAYGASKALIGAVVGKLKDGISTANQLPQGMGSMKSVIPKVADATGKYLEKNPPSLGLSMRDVSGGDAFPAEVKSMRLNSAADIRNEFEDNGSAVIAEGNGVRLTAKDEGDHVKVSIGDGGLVSTDTPRPSRTFATLDDALSEIRDFISKKDTPAQGRFVGMTGDLLKQREASAKTDMVLRVDKKVYRGEGSGIGNATFTNGRYFADSKDFASTFGDVTEHTIPKGTRVFDFDAIKSDPNQTVIPKQILVNPEATRQFLVSRGYKATKNTNSRGVEYVMLDDADSLSPATKMALESKSYQDFLKKGQENYGKIRDEMAAISAKQNAREASLGTHTWQTIWERAQRIKDQRKEAQELLEKYAPNDARKSTTADASYVYHTTSPAALESIARQGIKPSKGQYGNGVYFAPSPELTGGYGSAEGAMLRVKREVLPGDFQEFPEQGWTGKTIPPKDIEVSIDKGATWKPLVTKKITRRFRGALQ